MRGNMTIRYLEGNKITRRIMEFPPVESDEDLENFQKLIGKMWIELEPYFRGKISQPLTQEILTEFETLYPFAHFYQYDNNHIALVFDRDYLDKRNMCVDGYGKIKRKMSEM